MYLKRKAVIPTETISDSLERSESQVQPTQDFRINKILATPAVRKMAIDYKVSWLTKSCDLSLILIVVVLRNLS